MNLKSHLLYAAVLCIGLFILFTACSQSQKSQNKQAEGGHPEWTKNANIYEVNIRQYTPEGTFKAFQEHLPRLQKMGVDILWLMPVYPIGKKNRKGKLGSYYSVKNYKAVNPHFGTMQDFIELVEDVHNYGMKLIMDLVPNHTAWDNPWVTEHPEYYMHDSLGNITYEANWTDIAQLNYGNKAVWEPMIEIMKFWVNKADIDGYRVDHAGHDIPLAFWKKAIPEVNKVKDGLFWLAEWNTPEMHPWFDATYAWKYFHLTIAIAKNEKPLNSITQYMAWQDSVFPDYAYQIYFTTNHDENSWKGTDEELFGDNFQNFAVMAATINGMPLIYSGQETGLEQQLAFFEKDTIDWDGYKYAKMYRTLLGLKHSNQALWNGQYGGKFVHVENDRPESIYSYRRVKGEDVVLVVLNFSDQNLEVTLNDFQSPITYTNVFTGKPVTISGKPVSVEAHGFLVLKKGG